MKELISLLNRIADLLKNIQIKKLIKNTLNKLEHSDSTKYFSGLLHLRFAMTRIYNFCFFKKNRS